LKKDPFFTHFNQSIANYSLPEKFTFPFKYQPHPLSIVAAEQLQQHLMHQTEWKHNFGLSDDKQGTIAGKMFGVLLVQNEENEIGYLAAFSGKLAGGNHHTMFVPPVFDLLAEDGFLSLGMTALSSMTAEIKELNEGLMLKDDLLKLSALKSVRKNYSIALQKEIFEHYHFLNQAGEEKSLNELFKHTKSKTPPSGAGECAAPKLLQYAFQHHMKPLALAEFWWGLSPKSETWKHGQYYPCCHEKCEPILAHMLEGMEINYEL